MKLSSSIEADAENLLLSDDLSAAQFGMGVESAQAVGDVVTIRTTGADFVFERAKGALKISRRSVRERSVATVLFPAGRLDSLMLEGSTSGSARLSAGKGRLQLRINGDSLLMLRNAEPMILVVSAAFRPSVARRFMGNVMFLDEQAGLGCYPATGTVADATGSDDSTVIYDLAAGQILWISVAPPKPYPWEQSFRDRVVWHHSKETGYPSDVEIGAWSRHSNLLLQQSEVMLWKDWSLRFVPRNGVGEFQRVVDTCRRFGMRNYVYTSPFYFLPGTGLEDKAMNTFENFKGFSPGDGRGLNWPMFLEEIRRVMREYRPAGLYFDGMYNNIVRTYLLARKAREVVGDSGILEYHATLDDGPCQHTPPGGGLYLPQIDAYFDFILRGESQHARYAEHEFLRYSVSTYNLSNSIGVLCNNYNYKLDAAFIERLLARNIRLHSLASADDAERKLLEENYFPKLNASLRERVNDALPK